MKLDIINKCICLCAKRNSGKSVLLKYIVQANKHLFDSIFVICPSDLSISFIQTLFQNLISLKSIHVSG